MAMEARFASLVPTLISMDAYKFKFLGYMHTYIHMVQLNGNLIPARV